MANNAINSLKYGDNTYTFTLPYGECGTAAGTAAKTVTIDNFSLETGAAILVKFTNKNSASSPTLNVNSTGAKAIKIYGTTNASTDESTTGWAAGAVQMFVYDGTYWVRDYWRNSTYSAATQSANGLMSAADKTKLDGINSGAAVSSVNGATGAVTFNYAGSSSVGGPATTVAVTNTTPTSATTYYPLYTTSTSGSQTVRANSDLYYYDTGSASYFNVGSSSQLGGLTLHQNNRYYTNIVPGSLTTNRTITLPNVDGTVITTGNLPAVATQSANGLMSSTDKKKLDNISYGTANPSSSTTGYGVAGALYFKIIS